MLRYFNECVALGFGRIFYNEFSSNGSCTYLLYLLWPSATRVANLKSCRESCRKDLVVRVLS